MNQVRVFVIETGRAIRDCLAGARGAYSVSWSRSHDLAPKKPAPELVVINLCEVGGDASSAVERLTRIYPEAPLLAITDATGDKELLALLRAGATGVLFKDDLDQRLLSAIEEAMKGGAPMSRAVARMVLARARRQSAQMQAVRSQPAPQLGARKREILDLLALGHSYDQIGSALGLSINTVRSHVREIYASLEVSSKVEAVLVAVEHGIILKPQA